METHWAAWTLLRRLCTMALGKPPGKLTRPGSVFSPSSSGDLKHLSAAARIEMLGQGEGESMLSMESSHRVSSGAKNAERIDQFNTCALWQT